MTSRIQANANGSDHALPAPWLQRLGVFVLVASGLSLVGTLAVTQTHRQPATTNPRSVSATIESSSPSAHGLSVDAWQAEILSPVNIHTTIAELRLDQDLLPRSEKFDSPSQWEARVRELLQVEAVSDRRHADNVLRITFPVGRNVSQAVALVNGLSQRAVADREKTARKAAEVAEQGMLARRTSTARSAEELQQLQSELAGFKKSNPREEVSDKNSVAVEAYFAERRAQLSHELAEHQSRRELLLETLLPAHPEVRALDSKIETVQAALAQIPTSKNPTDIMALPPGTDSSPRGTESKLLEAVTAKWTEWQRLTSEQTAAEQHGLTLPSYSITLAQAPVVQATGEKPSTAMYLFVVLAAVAVGIASAGWVRNVPAVLRSARQVEKSLHLKVLAVLPSAGVKI